PARRLSALSVAFAVGLSLTGAGAASAHPAVRPAAPRAPVNLNVSRESGNQAEDAVAIQQTNPNNVVIVANEGSASALFHGWSTDGGRTWQTDRIADGDNLGTACCDPALAADNFGNIFLTWLASTGPVQVALSTDGVATFIKIASLAVVRGSAGQTLAHVLASGTAP